MSLFSADEVRGAQGTGSGFDDFIVFKSKTRTLLLKNRQRLKDAIPTLVPGEDIRFVNGGRWSAHDLLFHLLSITGPAEVCITTWAISETAARLLYQAKEEGLVLGLYGIFDRRLPARKPKVAQFIERFFDKTILLDCHAKMFVLMNDRYTVSCCMTCNYSNNRRIETGHICTNPEVAAFDRDWILGVINQEDRFEWKR